MARTCFHCHVALSRVGAEWCDACGTVQQADDEMLVLNQQGYGEMCVLGPRDRSSVSDKRVCGLARWWDSLSHRERNDHTHVVELTRLAEAMRLSTRVTQDAVSFFQRGAIPGAQGKRLLVGAALFHACKAEGAPRSTREIARLLGAAEVHVRKSCIELSTRLRLTGAPPVIPGEFSGGLAASLGLSESQRRALAEMHEDASGRNPMLLAGARVLALGWADVDSVAIATGLSAHTLHKAVMTGLGENSVSTQHGGGRGV
jgi:hypothetical protein